MANWMLIDQIEVCSSEEEAKIKARFSDKYPGREYRIRIVWRVYRSNWRGKRRVKYVAIYHKGSDFIDQTVSD